MVRKMKYFWLDDPLSAAAEAKRYDDVYDNEIEVAENALRNTFIFRDRHEMERCTEPVVFSNEIDWNHVPFGDPEWNFAFSRHTFLLHLAKSYAMTGDERYRDGWIRLFSDFCTRTDLNELSVTRSWRSLDTGIRVENHLRSFEILDSIKPLPEEIRKMMEDNMRKHVFHLLRSRDGFHRLSNWGVLQDHGLFLASVFLGDKESLETAIKRLEEETLLQIYPDGSTWEEATMYMGEVLRALLDVILIAERQSIELPLCIIERTHKTAIAFSKSLRPDGISYLFGDSDEIDMTDILYKASIIFSDGNLSYFCHDVKPEEILWDFPLEAKKPDAMIPDSISAYFPDSGNAFVRLSSDTAFHFRAGGSGSGHGHLDQLHFDLFGNDRVFITDSGRFTYVPDDERWYFKGTRAHNTIMVDGLEMADPNNSIMKSADAAITKSIIADSYTFHEGINLAYSDIGMTVRRRILTLSDEAVIIEDEFSGMGNHSAEALFHLDPTISVELNGNEAEINSPERMMKLVFSPQSELFSEECYISRKYNEKEKSLAIVRRDEIQDGIGIRWCVIFPYGEGAVKQIPVDKSKSGMTVPETDGLGLELDIKSGRYDVCFIRNEFRNGGYLLRAGKAEAYARVFFRKEDCDVVRVRC